jgi:hypothetical protein
MNEPKTVTNAALDKLPLFATDLEIAVAIVGKQNASRWKRDVIPVLEHRGFPRFDPLHQGRPVPLVKQFYAHYFGITEGFTLAKPSGEDRVGTWIPKRLRNRIKEEERRRAAGEDPSPTLSAAASAGELTQKQQKAAEEYRSRRATEFATKKKD